MSCLLACTLVLLIVGRLIFFFFLDRLATSQKKLHSIQEVYSQPKKTKGATKNLTTPHLNASHSKKPMSEEISSPRYNLFQLHKLCTKDNFNLCTIKVPSLKAIRYLSFQIVQKMKMQMGIDLQIFLLFFSHKRTSPAGDGLLDTAGKVPVPFREKMSSHKSGN